MEDCASEDDAASICFEVDEDGPLTTKSRRRRRRGKRSKHSSEKSYTIGASDAIINDALGNRVFGDRAAQTLADLGLLITPTRDYPCFGPVGTIATGVLGLYSDQSTSSPQ